MHEAGLGVPQSAHDAFQLFSLAADQGYAPAIANLGRAYAHGSGVKRDDTRAYALISAAVEIGMRSAEREAAVYELGAISQRLDDQQLARARADAHAMAEARLQAAHATESGGHNAYRL
jgi:TPR repeat protein